ncbi:MAG: hypothetical protein ACAI25_09215 [Planctomycetota bacterium]
MLRRFLLAVFTAFLLATPALAQPNPQPAPRSEPERNANGDFIFYRRVSNWEMRNVLKKNGLFLTPGSGETFISTSREYVDQLGARHPKDYANLLILEVQVGVMEALEKLGLRSPGNFLAKLYPNMPAMEKDRPDAVHFKAEMEVLNLGLRTGSIDRFNEFLRTIRVDKTATLTVPKDTRSIKERYRRGVERGTTTGVTEVLTARTLDAKDRDRTRGR